MGGTLQVCPADGYGWDKWSWKRKMEFSKKKIKQICGLMAFAALLVLTVMHSGIVYTGLLLALRILKPFLIGGVIAFVLNLPLKMFEEKIFRKWKGKAAGRLKRPVSLLLAITLLILILTLVIVTVVPQVSKTVSELGRKIPVFADQVVTQLEEWSVTYPQLKEQAETLQNLEINWNSLLNTVTDFLRSGAVSMLTSTVTVAGNIIGGVVNTFISFIFALYILSQKEKLGDQGRRILHAYLPEKAERQINKVLALLYKNFSNFITGQCLEAIILGSMFVVSMSLFRMPYAFMVGVLIAFTALIPIVGAFVGCVVGAFLILIENPVMAVWFVVMFLVLQQIEGNLIYPKVVGSSVGLPSIWVLMAVTLGGSLFGIAGMLFFIPLLSAGYSLLRDSVNSRNEKGLTEQAIEKAAEEDEELPDAVLG